MFKQCFNSVTTKYMNKTFIISDESVNSNGFRIITRGIDTTQFVKNPVMLYMHNSDLGVIGRWENLRIKGTQLLADPVFDESDDLAMKIKGKVERGFIRSASIGIRIDEDSMKDGVVYSCCLKECSIVDIPSNGNALVLYDKDNRRIENPEEFVLSLKLKTDKMNDLKAIIEVLGLPADATVDDIVAAITALKQTASPEADIEKAVKMKWVSEYEKPGLLALSYRDPQTFSLLMEGRKKEIRKERATKGSELIKTAMLAGTINNDSEGKVREFWLNAFIDDFETTKHVLESLPKRVYIAPLIEQAKKERGNWTLNDYRKNAPQELKSNPLLYQTLIEQEQQQKQKRRNNYKY